MKKILTENKKVKDLIHDYLYEEESSETLVNKIEDLITTDFSIISHLIMKYMATRNHPMMTLIASSDEVELMEGYKSETSKDYISD